MNEYNSITIHPLSASTQEKRYLLSCEGRYYETSSSIAELLVELQQNATQEEAVNAYIHKTGGRYTAEQIKQVINKFIVPVLSVPKQQKRTFLYEKELFPATAIDRFSDAFRFLFNKIYMICVGIVVLVLDVLFFTQTSDLLVFNDKVNAYTIIGILLFMLASSFFHELGHASACKYFGIRHGGIGFGLYLNFPVLYTDVTEVWKLQRKQRLIVNVAGIYFQSFCLIGLLIGFMLTGNNMLRYLILIMNLGFLMTLNPFFKFDGYWLASDLLGVPNLRNRSKELLTYLYKRLRKYPVNKKPYLFQIRKAEMYGLAIYSVIVNVFMGYYFLYIIPVFLFRFVCSFPEEMQDLILYLSNRITPPFALLRNIAMQLLFIGLLGFFLTNVIRKFRKKPAKHE